MTLGLLGCATPALAQQARWSVTAEVGGFRYGAAARDTSQAGDGTLRLDHPAMAALRLERRIGAFRAGLAFAYASGAPSIDGPETAIVARDNPLRMYELAPTVSVRVARLGAAAELRLEGGPVLDRWTWDLEASRTRIGAQGAVSVEAALGSGVYGVVRAGIGVTGSMFQPGELPDGYARQGAWRRSLALGLRAAWHDR